MQRFSQSVEAARRAAGGAGKSWALGPPRLPGRPRGWDPARAEQERPPRTAGRAAGSSPRPGRAAYCPIDRGGGGWTRAGRGRRDAEVSAPDAVPSLSRQPGTSRACRGRGRGRWPRGGGAAEGGAGGGGRAPGAGLQPATWPLARPARAAEPRSVFGTSARAPAPRLRGVFLLPPPPPASLDRSVPPHPPPPAARGGPPRPGSLRGPQAAVYSVRESPGAA